MLRIKGTIGAWPVDLTLELDAADWAQLAAHLPNAAVEPSAEPAPVARSAAAAVAPSAQDALWQAAQALLQQEQEMEGPQLLAALAGLAGNDAAGKRLLVRLRHCPQVQLENGAQAPLYRWVG